VKLHVSSTLRLENEAYNGDAFWLWNMREQWAFVHDLQIQEVREEKQRTTCQHKSPKLNPTKSQNLGS